MLVDQGESALYEIERELVDERDFTAAIPVLADCGDRPKMRHVFERYPPAVVFHAAAYKHVPMLEANPLQAVTNNVLATRAIAEVAVEFGVERFVLISTDKAAKPKNLLGQSKAVCEWIVESFAAARRRRDALRRGALRQRARLVGLGDPDLPPPDRARRPGHGHRIPSMTRFFMTIPEAASLVVQAGAMGGRGQVYVLDMGKPVKIVDLARQMIELSGRTEEQIADPVRRRARRREAARGALERRARTSARPRTRRSCARRRSPIDGAWLEDELAELERLVAEGDTLGVVAKLRAMMREQRRTGSAVLEDTLH